MAGSQQPSPLLLALRERSAAVRNAEPSTSESGAVDPRDIDRRLLSAFRWLEEAFAHLGVIRPAVAHRFALADVLTIAAPRYDRGYVAYRRREIAGFDLIERIEIYYRLANDEPIRVEIHPGAAAAIEERLRAAQLDFRYRIEHDGQQRARGVFTVTPAVMAAIRLAPDYERGVVVTTLCNVDRLEPVTLEFVPTALGEPALEDLVRFILGEPNGFLRRAPLAGVGARSAASARRAVALSPSRYRRST